MPMIREATPIFIQRPNRGQPLHTNVQMESITKLIANTDNLPNNNRDITFQPYWSATVWASWDYIICYWLNAQKGIGGESVSLHQIKRHLTSTSHCMKIFNVPNSQLTIVINCENFWWDNGRAGTLQFIPAACCKDLYPGSGVPLSKIWNQIGYTIT